MKNNISPNISRFGPVFCHAFPRFCLWALGSKLLSTVTVFLLSLLTLKKYISNSLPEPPFVLLHPWLSSYSPIHIHWEMWHTIVPAVIFPIAFFSHLARVTSFPVSLVSHPIPRFYPISHSHFHFSQPSNTHISPTIPVACDDPDCFVYEGHIDYLIIGSSGSDSYNENDCIIYSSSSATLNFPPSIHPLKVILFWSASGDVDESQGVSCTLNKHRITAERVMKSGYKDTVFYGAYADVTNLVHRNGTYTVSDIWFKDVGSKCNGNPAYAVWTILAVYEKEYGRKMRLSACLGDFRVTYPAGKYTFDVKCLKGRNGGTGRSAVVMFNGKNYRRDVLYMMGRFVGFNVASGESMANLDVVELRMDGVMNLVKDRLTFTVWTLSDYSQGGAETEAVTMPVRVAMHTL